MRFSRVVSFCFSRCCVFDSRIGLDVEASRHGTTVFAGFAGAGGRSGRAGRAVAARIGSAVWDRGEHGDCLGPAFSRDGQRLSGSNGWAQAAQDLRRPPHLAAGALPRTELHAARPDCRAGRAGSGGRLSLGVGIRPRREAQLQKKTLVASERDRPDVARRRAQWLKYRPRIDPSRLVFIDETWTKTNMAPLRGWAPRGERLPGKAPFGHWNTMTVLAALRHDRVEAPWLLDRPINGERVLVYIEPV